MKSLIVTRVLIPAAVILFTLALWELLVRAFAVPVYIVPSPLAIAQSLWTDWGLFSQALLATLQVVLLALLGAVCFGVPVALLMSQSKWLELMFFPYMVILQVVPIIAIAPLIVVWVNSDVKLALFICATLVAFFPIVSNTITGLKSTDRHLEDLFRLYGASRWQTLWRLRLPSAMPYFLSGLRVSGGLSLIGAIVAEFAAGTGGQGSGLAFQILMAGYQMNMPRMFAALALISAVGLVIHLALTGLTHLALRHWHESALRRES